jgi:8-oxo-dGTP diphosphatase
MSGTGDRIEAAGAVVVAASDGTPMVLVVHRPHRSDWSLPKGKLEPGERHDSAAVREVFEETGVQCVLGPLLGTREYLVEGQPKRVVYWRATPATSTPRTADAEVDEVRWVDQATAEELLTYQDDRDLVRHALGLPDTEAIIILRHEEATKRAAWRESGDPRCDDDSARPLTDVGLERSVRLIDGLRAYGPSRVVTSDARRCQQTVTPFADALGVPLLMERRFSEFGCIDDPDSTRQAAEHWWNTPGSAVWCSHRPVLPILLGRLERMIESAGGLTSDVQSVVDVPRDSVINQLDPRLKPGDALLIHRDGERRVIAIDRRYSEG